MKAAILVLASGCSFAFTPTPPARPRPDVEPVCSTSRANPIVDLAMVPTYTTAGVLIATDREGVVGAIAIGVGLAASVVSLISGADGIATVRACREIQAEWRARRAAR